MEARNLTELRAIVDTYLEKPNETPPTEAIRAVHERLTKLEELFHNLSRKISSSQSLSTRVEAIFEEGKKPKD